MITQDEFDTWKADPVTLAFFSYLKEKQEEVKNDWANHVFIRETSDMTVMENARALGVIEAIDDIFTTELGDLNGQAT